jgi:hypothetical protein
VGSEEGNNTALAAPPAWPACGSNLARHSFFLSACVRLFFPCATAHYIVQTQPSGNPRSPAIRAAPAGPAVGGSTPAAARLPHRGSTLLGCRGSIRLILPLGLGTGTGHQRQRCQAACRQGLPPHRSLRQQRSRLSFAHGSHRRRHCCRCSWRRAGWHCSAQNVGRDRLRQACRHRHSMPRAHSRWNK